MSGTRRSRADLRTERRKRSPKLKEKFESRHSVSWPTIRVASTCPAVEPRSCAPQGPPAKARATSSTHVVKNSVLKRRGRKAGDAEALTPHSPGPTAVALSYGDPVGLAKVLVDFAEEERGASSSREACSTARPVDTPKRDRHAGDAARRWTSCAESIVGLLQAPGHEARQRLLNEPASQTGPRRRRDGVPNSKETGGGAARGRAAGSACLIEPFARRASAEPRHAPPNRKAGAR